MGDLDDTGRCFCAGCVGMGPCERAEPDEDYRCCALDEGHDGPCASVCSTCGGDGRCPICGGEDDLGCHECGGTGSCWDCQDGMQVDDLWIPPTLDARRG